jgi:hypothetical protein
MGQSRGTQGGRLAGQCPQGFSSVGVQLHVLPTGRDSATLEDAITVDMLGFGIFFFSL